jgi:hypothetical protein
MDSHLKRSLIPLLTRAERRTSGANSRWVAIVVTQKVLHCSTCEIRWIADSAWLLSEKARSHAPFVMVGWSYSSILGCSGKRFYVAELS